LALPGTGGGLRFSNTPNWFPHVGIDAPFCNPQDFVVDTIPLSVCYNKVENFNTLLWMSGQQISTPTTISSRSARRHDREINQCRDFLH
jgi:hypothetical protein